MKPLAFLFFAIRIATAGELIVLVPADNDNQEFPKVFPSIESFADGDFDKTPKRNLVQEGQLTRYIYREVNPGKYRVRLEIAGTGIGFTDSLMETHVVVGKVGSVTVYLYAPRNRDVKLPDEIAAAIMKHGNAFMDLSARYKGSSKAFYQVRTGTGGSVNPKLWIHYLRSDAEYTIELRDIIAKDSEAPNEAYYKKTFRVGSK